MTMVALASLPESSVLVVDAIIPTKDRPGTRDDLRMGDKIRYWQHLNAFTTLVGDEMLLWGLEAVVEWYQGKNRPFSLEAAVDIDATLMAAKKAREAIRQRHPKMPSLGDSTLYICDSRGARYWQLQHDEKMDQLIRVSPVPTHVDDGFVLVDYGGERNLSPMPSITDIQAPQALWNCLISRHEKARSFGPVLPYDPGDRFGAAVCRKDGTSSATTSPYRFLTDHFAGTQSLWDLLDSPSYRWSPF